MTPPRSRLPLTGVRVLDLTHVWSGPMATRVLAALGAEVLKVEGPDRPDFLRGRGAVDVRRRYPDLDPGSEPENRNAWFNTQNTDKRSVVLDLKSARGRELLLELVAHSDVVANNFRPGVLDRMGLGYEALTHVRPDVILVEMPGYAGDGPMRGLAGYGAQFEARTGAASLMGAPGRPVLTGFALADPTAGLTAAGAVVTALARRRRTGKGGRIEVVQSEAMLPLVGEHLLATSVGQASAVPVNGDAAAWWQSIVALRDGSWLAVRVDDENQAQTVRELLELSPDSRPVDVERALAGRGDAAQLARRLQQRGVSAAPVASLEQVFHDSHLRAAGFYAPLKHDDAGVHDHPGFPGLLAGQRPAPRRSSPRFGADTRAVLTDLLGLDPQEVDRLAAHHIVTTTGHRSPPTDARIGNPTPHPFLTSGEDMSQLVRTTSDDGITRITLSRADKLNALNVPLVEQLRQALIAFEAGEDRVAVLHGDGRAFSVGADLNDNPLDLWTAVPGLGVEVSKPIVAAVHGHCIGGAFVLAMQSDLVVVEERTRFSYPEVLVGFTGGIAAGLAARVPAKVAAEFLLLGQSMDAERAYEVGMVNRVVPQGDSLKIALEWAGTLRDAAPLVVSTLKEFMAQTIGPSPSELAARARRRLLPIQTSEDRLEGERAFREKRAPQFTGR